MIKLNICGVCNIHEIHGINYFNQYDVVEGKLNSGKAALVCFQSCSVICNSGGYQLAVILMLLSGMQVV